MSKWGWIHRQLRLVAAWNGPKLPTVDYPIPHAGKLVAACHGADGHETRGPVIRMRVARAGGQHQRRMNLVENRLKIILQVLPGIGVARREGAGIGNRRSGCELRAIRSYVVVRKQGQDSAVGIAQEI